MTEKTLKWKEKKSLHIKKEYVDELKKISNEKGMKLYFLGDKIIKEYIDNYNKKEG